MFLNVNKMSKKGHFSHSIVILHYTHCLGWSDSKGISLCSCSCLKSKSVLVVELQFLNTTFLFSISFWKTKFNFPIKMIISTTHRFKSSQGNYNKKMFLSCGKLVFLWCVRPDQNCSKPKPARKDVKRNQNKFYFPIANPGQGTKIKHSVE